VSSQHIVFAVKFLIAAFIPDVPSDVRLNIKRVRIAIIVHNNNNNNNKNTNNNNSGNNNN